jgi:hypothetical protein
MVVVGIVVAAACSSLAVGCLQSQSHSRVACCADVSEALQDAKDDGPEDPLLQPSTVSALEAILLARGISRLGAVSIGAAARRRQTYADVDGMSVQYNASATPHCVRDVPVVLLCCVNNS